MVSLVLKAGIPIQSGIPEVVENNMGGGESEKECFLFLETGEMAYNSFY